MVPGCFWSLSWGHRGVFLIRKQGGRNGYKLLPNSYLFRKKTFFFFTFGEEHEGLTVQLHTSLPEANLKLQKCLKVIWISIQGVLKRGMFLIHQQRQNSKTTSTVQEAKWGKSWAVRRQKLFKPVGCAWVAGRFPWSRHRENMKTQSELFRNARFFFSLWWLADAVYQRARRLIDFQMWQAECAFPPAESSGLVYWWGLWIRVSAPNRRSRTAGSSQTQTDRKLFIWRTTPRERHMKASLRKCRAFLITPNKIKPRKDDELKLSCFFL